MFIEYFTLPPVSGSALSFPPAGPSRESRGPPSRKLR